MPIVSSNFDTRPKFLYFVTTKHETSEQAWEYFKGRVPFIESLNESNSDAPMLLVRDDTDISQMLNDDPMTNLLHHLLKSLERESFPVDVCITQPTVSNDGECFYQDSTVPFLCVLHDPEDPKALTLRILYPYVAWEIPIETYKDAVAQNAVTRGWAIKGSAEFYHHAATHIEHVVAWREAESPDMTFFQALAGPWSP